MVRLARDSTSRPLIGDGDGFVPLSAIDESYETVNDVLRAAANRALPSPKEVPVKQVPADYISFLHPFHELGKLWCIGLNYAEHASDLNETRPNEPASFMKPATTVTGPGGPVRLPSKELTDHVTAEAELGVVVGKTCSDLSTDEAKQVIAGYTPIIDMTAEDILSRNPRYLTKSKSFDSFMVLGPWLITPDEVGQLDDLTVRTVYNDAVVAENQISNMMVNPHELVSHHSKIMTLEAGDIISTGTPGAQKITPGDVVRSEIDRIGSVSAPVVH